jgi:3-methyladenine DNA glycosylase AlkD
MYKVETIGKVNAVSYANDLRKKFLVLATNEKKWGAEAYMRHQFTFIGVDTTTRRNEFKRFLQENGTPGYADLSITINYLFTLERELHYCGVELGILYKKEWDIEFITTIEKCILTNSWWDTVDHIASEWTGPYFKLFPRQIIPITGRWNLSDNFWLQRSSLLFQKKYKEQTDKNLLAKYILNCADSNEFFIQKAIGWALREYAKTNPAWVKEFVKQHKLKPLSCREALKHF